MQPATAAARERIAELLDVHHLERGHHVLERDDRMHEVERLAAERAEQVGRRDDERDVSGGVGALIAKVRNASDLAACVAPGGGATPVTALIVDVDELARGVPQDVLLDAVDGYLADAASAHSLRPRPTTHAPRGRRLLLGTRRVDGPKNPARVVLDRLGRHTCFNGFLRIGVQNPYVC